VSPFNPMEMRYDWRSNTPGERLAIHLENHTQRGREFDATLALKAQPISAGALNAVLLRFPLMTAKVALAIYWQALKLFLKAVPYYPHPGPARTNQEHLHERQSASAHPLLPQARSLRSSGDLARHFLLKVLSHIASAA
jgi:DUF1365 family protein